MKDYIVERIESEAHYIIDNKCTIRAVASKFRISKSTVQRDLHDILPTISKQLSDDVNEIINENLKERHLRGGFSTKAKYEKIRSKLHCTE